MLEDDDLPFFSLHFPLKSKIINFEEGCARVHGVSEQVGSKGLGKRTPAVRLLSLLLYFRPMAALLFFKLPLTMCEPDLIPSLFYPMLTDSPY